MQFIPRRLGFKSRGEKARTLLEIFFVRSLGKWTWLPEFATLPLELNLLPATTLRQIDNDIMAGDDSAVTLRTRKFIRNPLLGRKQMVV